jgi:hypothetical protein
MAREHKPEIIEIVCDACGIKEEETRRGRFSVRAQIAVSFDLFGFDGCAHARSDTMLDLCDTCFGDIREVINDKAREIKEKTK